MQYWFPLKLIVCRKESLIDGTYKRRKYVSFCFLPYWFDQKKTNRKGQFDKGKWSKLSELLFYRFWYSSKWCFLSTISESKKIFWIYKDDCEFFWGFTDMHFYCFIINANKDSQQNINLNVRYLSLIWAN